MAKFLIVETKDQFERLVTDTTVFRNKEPIIWLWDDEVPNERVYVSGDCIAYVPGDRVSFLTTSGKPKPSELVFKEQNQC